MQAESDLRTIGIVQAEHIIGRVEAGDQGNSPILEITYFHAPHIGFYKNNVALGAYSPFKDSKTMPKNVSEKNSDFMKYALVDKPILSRKKEDIRFILSRNKKNSTEFSVKKFFAKSLMKMEAKKHIARILGSEQLKNEPSAQKLLKKIKETPFWRGVKVEEFKEAMSYIPLDKITEFVESNKNGKANVQKNALIKSLFSELPDLENSYLQYKNHYIDKISVNVYEDKTSFEASENKIDSYENHADASSESCDEEFSSFESEEDIDSDFSENDLPSSRVENADQIKQADSEKQISHQNTKTDSSHENFSAQTDHVNSKKLQNEKNITIKGINDNIKKEKEQLEMVQALEQDELAKTMKQESIATAKELNDLKKVIKSDDLKKKIQTTLESRFEQNEEKNRSIYEGLNELISHATNLNKECSIEGNKKISAFMKALEKTENELKDRTDLAFYEQITNIFTFYAEKYEAARLKGQLAEITKVMHPESESSAIEEKQKKLAGEIRAKLKEVSVFNRHPEELDAFIDYFKNPETEFDEERTEYYAAFLNIFYDNIRLLDQKTQTQCLNVADQLEGELQYDAQSDFGLFDTEDMDTKQPEFFDLINYLKDYDTPSSSLLSFFEYLKDGQRTINKYSYWKLLQFSVNRSSAMQPLLKLGDTDFFKAAIQRLNADLRQYASIKNINKPVQ